MGPFGRRRLGVGGWGVVEGVVCQQVVSTMKLIESVVEGVWIPGKT